MRQVPLSRVAFAIVMIAVGLWGFAVSSFVAIWAPGIQPAGLRAPMAFACSLVSTAAGGGLLWRGSARLASRVLLGLLLIWLIWCKGPPLIHAPTELASWESLGETLVMVAAAWALAAGLDGNAPNDRTSGPLAQFGPRILYGLALIAFGAAHFGYPALTASLVPMWLPQHLAWVYLTGAAFVAAGLALVVGRLVRPAAVLSALQMLLFGVLVWLPRIAAGAHDADTLNEAGISFALAASGWVIATALTGRGALKTRLTSTDIKNGGSS